MNKSYRLIYNEITQTWVAVSEIAKGRGKRASGAVLLAGAVALSPALAAPPNPPAATQLPTGGQVVAGQANISQSAATLTVNQTSNRAALDWQTFNVGKSATVNFKQPDSSSVTLNRVADPNPSQIFGRINANGQVFLSNPSGVYFAPGASVDVGGLVATTHRIGLDDFMAGKARFERADSTGSVLNEGELKAALGGYIALLAPEVRNQGVIIAQAGTVALASGEAVTLHIEGGNTLAGITVSPSLIAALVENKSMVLAPGGLIILSAQAANKLQGGVIKNSGTLDASSLVSRGGRILLDASDRIEHTGTITAAGSATQAGGSVEITAPQVELSGSVDVSGSTGGSVQLKAAENLVVRGASVEPGGAQAQVNASGTGTGGSVELAAGGSITVTDAQVDTSGDTQGGKITVRADKTLRQVSQDTATPLAPVNPPNDPTAPPEDRPLVAITGNTSLRSNGRRGKGGVVEITGDNIAQGGTLSARQISMTAKTGSSLNFGNVTLDGVTQAEPGGSVKIDADTVIGVGTVSANGGGSVDIAASHAATLFAAARIEVQGGGAIKLVGGDVLASNTFDASNATGGGGKIEVTGNSVKLAATTLDASGATGGGTIHVGGEWQGSGTLKQSVTTYVNPSTSMDVSAKSTGNGGEAVVWATDTTRFYGSIRASGGSQSGDGGRVEVSGKNLSYNGHVDAGAPKGQAGRLLLDPKNITIDDATSTGTQAVTDLLPSYTLTAGSGYGADNNNNRTRVLANGDVVYAWTYDNTKASNAGAVYLFNGSTGAIKGAIYGATANSYVGQVGPVTVLEYGGHAHGGTNDYVVVTGSWGGASPTYSGAITLVDGTTGRAKSGADTTLVATDNSLLVPANYSGAPNNSSQQTTVTELQNGNYVVTLPYALADSNLTGMKEKGAVVLAKAANGKAVIDDSWIVSTTNALNGYSSGSGSSDGYRTGSGGITVLPYHATSNPN